MIKGQRLIGRTLAAVAAAAGIWLGADFVVEGWLSQEPFFDREGLKYTFNCTDQTLPADAFWVAFSDDGMKVTIQFRDRSAVLDFQRGGFVRDIYEGEGMTLTLDPEAFVTGYRPLRIGPCEGRLG